MTLILLVIGQRPGFPVTYAVPGRRLARRERYPLPETATWPYDPRARGAGDRSANNEAGCHAKMEANAPPQPLPARFGHGAAEDSRAGRGDHPDRVQRRAGLPLCFFPARVLLAEPRRRAWAAMTEPEDGAGLPSLLASLNMCGLPASVLAVVEREADGAAWTPEIEGECAREGRGR